jgi:lipoyl-dependent peroxiredoxin
MSDKTANVHWEGRGKQGVGRISTQTDALKSYPYGYGSRFEDDRRGTNPEELLAAAHAACFTMAFSFACDAAGFATSAIDTTASVRLVMKGKGFLIEHIGLRLEASVAGINEDNVSEDSSRCEAGLSAVQGIGERSRDYAHGGPSKIARYSPGGCTPELRSQRPLMNAKPLAPAGVSGLTFGRWIGVHDLDHGTRCLRNEGFIGH